MFCFSIWLENMSSVEVNNNVKTCFYIQKIKEMKTKIIKTKWEQNKNDNDS